MVNFLGVFLWGCSSNVLDANVLMFELLKFRCGLILRIVTNILTVLLSFVYILRILIIKLVC